MCEKKVPVLNSMIKNRNTRFLKSYTLNYTNTEGNEKLYEMVSNFDYEKPEEIGQNASGVVIVGFRDDELLLLREFRMGVNQFIYNMPAGHSEDGESVSGEILSIKNAPFQINSFIFFNCLPKREHTTIPYICDFSRGGLNVRFMRSHLNLAPRPQI